MRPIYTDKGYELGEVISALQKTIRRGLEEEAMYWAMTMLPKFEAYFWNRLVIISHEDIGLAAPNTVMFVQTCKTTYFELRERGDSGVRLVVANAILAMCRSPKSRLADYFQCAVIQDMESGKLRRDIPDYALDKHTNRGKSMGRGLDHWANDGCRLDKQSVDEFCADTGSYCQRALKHWASVDFVRLHWPKRGGKGKDDDEQMSLF